MQAWIPVACLASAVAIVAVGSAAAAEPVASDAVLRDAFGKLAGKTVFFGHKSVGMNVLDGLRMLAARSGAEVRIAAVEQGAAVPAGTLGHAWIGENEKPVTKLEAFSRFLDGMPAPGVDVALVKFCYVDFSADTDSAALFSRYQSTLSELRRRHPRTTFVHVTAPLSTVQGGAKSTLKQLLGKQPYGLVENVRREEFNSMLRQAYQGRDPFFDLARVESTWPDGRAETIEWKGRRVPSLVPAYAPDEGHLNEEGRIRAARELLSVLASIPVGVAEPPAAAPAPK